MTTRTKSLVTCLIALAFLGSSGCAWLPESWVPEAPKPWVKPYQRQFIADPIMQVDPYPLDSSFMQHAFSSREGARGAGGGSGGGCGCN